MMIWFKEIRTSGLQFMIEKNIENEKLLHISFVHGGGLREYFYDLSNRAARDEFFDLANEELCQHVLSQYTISLN
jgi:hypothetical protein